MAVLSAVARALVQERGRRAGSWALLVLMVPLGLLLLHAGRRFYDARGLCTCGYLGAVIAQDSAAVVALLGFFATRGVVEEDRRNRVGEVLAATPLGRCTYVLGKLLGACILLSALMLTLYAMTAAAQVLRAEAPFRPLELAWPFLLLALPAAVFGAGLALAFDVLPGLRQWPGDVLFMLLLLLNAFRGLTGSALVGAALQSYLSAHPGAFGGPAADRVFAWPGLPVAWPMVLPRLPWLGLGLALALAASLLFDRFQRGPARGPRWPWRRPAAKPLVAPPACATLAVSLPTAPAVVAPPWVAALAAVEAEARLALKGRWWYTLGCAGLFVAALLTPGEDMTGLVLALALLWPIGIIADLGCRERRQGTEELVLCAPRVRAWYLLWKWGAGLAVGVPVLLRPLTAMALRGHFLAMAAALVGLGFVVALAVACSTCSGGPLLFEALYLLVWWSLYAGIGKDVPTWLDLAGVWYHGRNPVSIALYALLAMGLLGLTAAAASIRRGRSG